MPCNLIINKGGKMGNLKQLMRERILNNEYCKFDLLKEIIPMEELLTEKPLNLRLKIAAMLDIKLEDIKPKAFNQWRRRLKLKAAINKKTISENKEFSSPASPIIDDIFNPVRQKENIEDFIKPVRRSNK